MRRIKVDIQMPIKRGKFIVGDVIDRLLRQRGKAGDDEVEITFYVDAGEDFNEINSPETEHVLGLTGGSDAHAQRIEVNLRAAYKRNRMLHLGTSPYVYFADPDVLLPDVQGIFAAMARGLDRHPRLGAIGVPYQAGNHVATGSMMLRRANLQTIGKIRGAGESCICNYIARRLWEADMLVAPLRTLRADHLDFERTRYAK